MKYKKGLIFICLLICLFSIASVVASDVNETVVANEDQMIDEEMIAVEDYNIGEVGTNEENELSDSSGTFTDLANEIANAGDELNLTRNYIYSSEDSEYLQGIKIDKKVVINGNGFCIDGLNQSRALKISFNNVSIRNIVFINCFCDGNSGAIYWSGSYGILSNCSFVNCVNTNFNSDGDSQFYGGAVYWKGSNGVLSNCSFVNCHSCWIYKSFSATEGGAVYWYGSKGVLSNCSFVNCYCYSKYSANVNGGAVNWYGYCMVLSNCSFVNCSANRGGAVYCNSPYGVLSNCSFVNCSADSGGAVLWYSSNGTLYECSFIGCSAFTGKSISWNKGDGIIQNCTFDNQLDYGDYCYAFPKFNFDLNVDVNDTLFGEPINVQITSSNQLMSNIKVILYNLSNSIIISQNNLKLQGNYQYFYHNLKEGSYNLTIIHYQDSLYSYKTISRNFVVFKETPFIETFDLKNVVANENFNYTITLNEDATGNITIIIFNQTFKGEVFNGKCKFNLNLVGGEYNFTIKYSGDSKYKSLVFNKTASVEFKNSTVSFKINDSIDFGEMIYINPIVTVGATGNVSVYINNNFISCKNIGEPFILPPLSAGNYILKVEYNGNKYYNFSEQMKNVSINKINTSILITPLNLTAGSTELNVILNDKTTGNITLIVKNKEYFVTLFNGSNIIKISDLPSGTYDYILIYSGDQNFNPTSNTNTLSIKIKESAIKISANDCYADEEVKVNYTITNGITGKLIVYVNGKPMQNTSIGHDINLGMLDAGNYTIKVVYNSEGYFSTCEDATNITVKLHSTNLTIGVDDIYADEVVKIDYNLTKGATGTLSVYVNNIPIKNIIVGNPIELNTLSSGNYTIKVIYNSNRYYSSCEDNANLIVKKYNSHIEIGSRDIIEGEHAIIDYNITKGIKGNISVYVNDMFNKSVKVGNIIDLGGLSFGDYKVELIYPSDNIYNPCSNITYFKVSKKSFVKFEINEITVFDSIYLNFKVNEGATGQISVYMDGIYNATINVGETYNGNRLSSGTHTIKAVFTGDEFYAGCENTTILKVNKVNTTIYVTHTRVTAGNTALSISLKNKTTGTVTVNIHNKNYTKTLSNGKTTIYIYDLSAGEYEYNVSYSGDSNFNQNTIKNNISIMPKESKISISSNDIYVDELSKINYILTSGATGILSVYANNEFIKNVTVGKNIELENLPYGNYTVKVIYNSDGYYATCHNITTLKVQKLTPTFNFTKNNASAGDDFVITYILNNDATGTITCNNSTNQLISGRVNFIIKNIKGGPHQFNITYSGDDKYNPINITVNTTIKFKNATVDFDVKDIMWGDTLTIAPTVTNGATGYLSIYIDNNLNSTININGRKDFTFYVGGYHSINVTYSGDEYYSSNSTVKRFNVAKLDSISAIKGNIEVDNSATVYVALNEDATGKVSVYIKGTKYTSNLINGVGTFRVPSLAAGTYSVIIDYEGDSKYNSIYTTKSLEVTLKPSTITLNVKNILTGDNLVITPVVTSSASGNLKVYVDNVLKKTISIGSSYTIEQPTIGSHNIRVVYGGDSYHQGNETKTTFRVFTFYPIEVQNSAIIYGTDKHFQAIFYDEYGDVAANKLVAFSVNGEDTVVMTDINGLAVFNKDLPLGTYTVTVINAYVNEEQDYSLKVFTSIESEDMTRAYNTGMDFKVKLLDENADTLSRGYALFNVNNKDYPVVADNNGIAILNANLPVGTYTVSTTNGRTGETKTNKITIVPSVEASNMIRGYNSGIDFKAKFLDADAKALVNQKVAFKIDNIEYEVTTDANGYAVLNEQLDVGTYEVTAINKVTGEKATRNLTIVGRIVENNDVIHIYGDESYYTIHVVGDDGKFVGENEIINININNIDYQIRTDSNGYASFRIDENIGPYEILAEYKGYEVYNEVYVLQRVNYIINIDVKDISYKQNAIINLNLSTFVNNAFVEFDVVGDNGYNEVFDQSASSYMSLPVLGLNAGKYTVTAKYYDLNTYKFSSMAKTFSVTKINPKIIIVAENVNVGETAIITVNMPDVEGDVEIKIGNTLTFNDYLVKNGVIIKEINDLPADDYNVYVTYKGDNNYNVFTQSAILTIIQPKELTKIAASDITTTQGTGTYLLATLKDIYGNVLVNKGVDIYFNGLNSILTTDKNGQVKLAIGGNLAPNTYIATISFVGDDYYVGSNTVAKVIVNKKPVKTTLTLKKVTVKRSAKKLTIQATLKVNGKGVKNKLIKFKFNKKTYKARTNAKGVAKIKIAKKVLKKLKKGKKVIYTATYGKITKKVTVKVKK